MSVKRPKTLDEYKAWLLKNHATDITKRSENHFTSVALRVKETFAKSAVWTDLLDQLRRQHEQFILATGYPLLSRATEVPELQIKSFESFFLKTFRANVLNNSNWPDHPTDGWTLPTNWYERANDIVRTCVSVRYFDGVRFLLERLDAAAITAGAKSKKYYVGGTDGYYAGHLYVKMPFEIPKITFDTETIEMSIEIQITTQIHEVIRQLLHQHFEKRRAARPQPPEVWQWEHGSEEFVTNYLGHMLHFVDGMIVDLRDRVRKGKP